MELIHFYYRKLYEIFFTTVVYCSEVKYHIYKKQKLDNYGNTDKGNYISSTIWGASFGNFSSKMEI